MIRLCTTTKLTDFGQRHLAMANRIYAYAGMVLPLDGLVSDAVQPAWYAMSGRLLLSHQEIQRVFGLPWRPADPD